MFGRSHINDSYDIAFRFSPFYLTRKFVNAIPRSFQGLGSSSGTGNVKKYTPTAAKAIKTATVSLLAMVPAECVAYNIKIEVRCDYSVRLNFSYAQFSPENSACQHNHQRGQLSIGLLFHF